MENEDKNHTTPFPLRLPLDLRCKVNESAKINERSVNSEIVYQLKNAYIKPYAKNNEMVSERAGTSTGPDSK